MIHADRQRDVDWLRSKCGRAGAVDLLLTADWPEGFHEMLPGGNPLPDHDSTAPSPPLGKLMEKLAPRYHFAARSHFFLCLPPYQNQYENLSLPQHITMLPFPTSLIQSMPSTTASTMFSALQGAWRCHSFLWPRRSRQSSPKSQVFAGTSSKATVQGSPECNCYVCVHRASTVLA
eukprot:SAG31_NODE_1310_length_8870_cov_2.332231_12_plen_176_part_00